MQEIKRFSLVRPSTQTPFHIDFDWWKNQEKNWRVYLIGYLCPEHQKIYSEKPGSEMIDWIDPETAEVIQVDGLQSVLINHCAKQPGFHTENTSLVDTVFRLLLANGNSPLTADEIGQLTHRQPDTILKTLAGTTVYKGIRPLAS